MGRGDRSPSWSLALALLAAVALIDRLVWITWFARGDPFAGRATVVAAYTVEAAATLAVLVALVVVVAPVLRRLPETNGSASRLAGEHGGAVSDR